MKKYVAFIVLFLLIAVPVIGYMQTERERIMIEHLKRVADLAILIEKRTDPNTPLGQSDQAQLRYIVQQLRTEAYQYEQAVQSGR